jgi:hypothetical protein
VIREIAIAPELLPIWIRSGQARFILNQISYDTGNLFSRFPKSWKTRVNELYTSASDLEKIQLTEILRCLWETGVERTGANNWEQFDWLTSALSDHARVPFDLILADRDHEHPTVVNGSDHLQLTGHSWSKRTSIRVRRTVHEISQAVAPFLARSKRIQFVDPHFKVERRYTEMLAAFIRCALNNRPKQEANCHFIYHVGYSLSENFEDSVHDFRKNRIFATLPYFLPIGTTLEFHFWKEIRRGAFHNRYILTNIGGVNFSAGLDVVTDDEHESYDDLSLMNREQYNANASRFSGGSCPGLEFLETVVVIGQARTR